MKRIFTAFIALAFISAINSCKKDDNITNNNDDQNKDEIVLTELQKDLIKWGPWKLTVNCGGEPCGYRTYTFSENTIDYKAYNLSDTLNTSAATYTYTVSADTLVFGTTTCRVKAIDSTQLTLCTLFDDCATYVAFR